MDKLIQYSRDELIELSKSPASTGKPSQFGDKEILCARKSSLGKDAATTAKTDASKGKDASSEDPLQLKPSSDLFKWAKKGCGNDIPTTSASASTTSSASSVKPYVGSGRVNPRDQEWNRGSFDGYGYGRSAGRNDDRRGGDIQRVGERDFSDLRSGNRDSNGHRRQPMNNGRLGGNRGHPERNSGRDGRDNRNYPRDRYPEEEKEPEWMSEGPTSQLDFIELKGFDDSPAKADRGTPRKGSVDSNSKREEASSAAKDKNGKIAAEAKPKEPRESKAAAAAKEPAAPPPSATTAPVANDMADEMFMALESNLSSMIQIPDDDEPMPGQSRFANWFNSGRAEQQPPHHPHQQPPMHPIPNAGWSSAASMGHHQPHRAHPNSVQQPPQQSSAEHQPSNELLQLMQKANINIKDLMNRMAAREAPIMGPPVPQGRVTNVADLENDLITAHRTPEGLQAPLRPIVGASRVEPPSPLVDHARPLQPHQSPSINKPLVPYARGRRISSPQPGYQQHAAGAGLIQPPMNQLQQLHLQHHHEQLHMEAERRQRELERLRLEQLQHQSPSAPRPAFADPFTPTSVIRKIASNKDSPLSDANGMHGGGGPRPITKTNASQMSPSLERRQQPLDLNARLMAEQHQQMLNHHRGLLDGNISPISMNQARGAAPPQPLMMGRVMQPGQQQPPQLAPMYGRPNGGGMPLRSPTPLMPQQQHFNSNAGQMGPAQHQQMVMQQFHQLQQRGADQQQLLAFAMQNGINIVNRERGSGSSGGSDKMAQPQPASHGHI